MRTIEFDLNAAHIFVQVIDSGSFTAAGRILGIPKSTVSDRVSELERRLGVSLLVRTTRKLRLTEIGANFFTQAKLGVGQLKRASEQASQSQMRPTGTLRITAPADLALHEFMRAVSKYRRKYPEVAVEFNFINREVDLIAEGYDIAIRGGELDDSTLIAKKLGSTHMILVASESYLKGAPPLRHPRDLDAHRILDMNDPSISKERRGLRTAGGKTAQVRISTKGISTNSFSAIKSLVSLGDGIALIPKALCKKELDQKKFIQVLPEWTTAEIHLYLVYPAQRFSSPKVKEFIPLLEEQSRGLLGGAAPGAPKNP
jgi:DNA-binding transcriptional LysR family regulator